MNSSTRASASAGVDSLPDWLVRILRDPETGAALRREGDGFSSGARHYAYQNGMLEIVHPTVLSGDDRKWNQFYEVFAPFYELTQRWMGRLMFGIDVTRAWEQVRANLPLKRGARVLEVSPGPGIMLELLRDAIGPEGGLVAVDLSAAMLRRCQRRKGVNASLVHANGEFLPFADESFDLIFHFGGVNLFNEPERALAEFVRVTKKGGIVSWGDEGFSPNYPDNFRRRMMIRMNPGYLRERPPVPPSLVDVQTYDTFDGLAYHVVGRKR